jgi:glycosyltransferase involved in cell wall biosynthesis
MKRGKFPGFDGNSRRVTLIGSGLAKNGCKVTVLVAYPPELRNCNDEFYKKHGFKYLHSIRQKYEDDPKLLKDIYYKIVGTFMIFKVFNLVNKQKPVDVIFVSGIGFIELLVTYLLARLYNTKIVIDKTDINYQFKSEHKKTLRGILSGINIGLGELFIRQYADIVFTVNSNLERMYRGKIKGKVRMIIPSPMDSQEYDCIGKEDPLLSHAKSKFKIVSVAVTELHLYGVNPFLQALSALRKRYDFHLFIIGSKSQRYMQVMNDKLEENNMKECTTVVGNVPPDRIPSIYINADVLLLPQQAPETAEGGFPGKTAEYLMSGTPVITTLFSDLDKYFKSDKNCLVVPYGDIEAYKIALCRLFDSDSLRNALGVEGKRTALDNFEYLKGTKRIVEDLKEAFPGI